MFGSTMLGVLIGLVFLYLLLSTVCSSLADGISHLLKLRAKGLARGINLLIKEDNIKQAFYKHPLISSLAEDGKHVHIPK